jgi:hypothetical protein
MTVQPPFTSVVTKFLLSLPYLLSINSFLIFFPSTRLPVAVPALISLTGLRSVSHDRSVDDSAESLFRQLHLLQGLEEGGVQSDITKYVC